MSIIMPKMQIVSIDDPSDPPGAPVIENTIFGISSKGKLFIAAKKAPEPIINENKTISFNSKIAKYGPDEMASNPHG